LVRRFGGNVTAWGNPGRERFRFALSSDERNGGRNAKGNSPVGRKF